MGKPEREEDTGSSKNLQIPEVSSSSQEPCSSQEVSTSKQCSSSENAQKKRLGSSNPSGKEKKKRKIDSSNATGDGKEEPQRRLSTRGIVRMQTIFNKEKAKTSRSEIEEIQSLLQKHYISTKKEYSEAVKREMEGDFSEWLSGPAENIYRKNLTEKGYQIPKTSEFVSFEENDAKISESSVTWIKPDKDENGRLMRKVRAPCARIEVGDICPPMIYWVPIEQSIVTKDQLRLTHMPYFNDSKDDVELFDYLLAKFPDGIHGFAENWDYVNDWILYKMFRKILQGFSGNPDALYYGMYRLWPNKMSQRELSQAFPSFCERFAENDLDHRALEPWKPSATVAPAKNLREPSCYSCLDFTCEVHGFKAEIPPEFPNGDIFCAPLALPSPEDQEYCSDDCWKKIDMKKVIEVLDPDKEEIEAKSMTIYIDKTRLTKIPVEDGSLIASMYPYNSSKPFCEFVAECVDENDEDCKVRTCRAAYELIMSLVENTLTSERFCVTQPPQRLSIKDRVQNFRRGKLNEEKLKKKKRHDELRLKAIEEGLDVDQLIAEEERRQHNHEKVRLTAVTPITACRHDGPCNPSAENCACSENGVCSYMCKCDVNCAQRFPGCNCTAGQCQTKACQCYRANWECNPMTCTRCKCDEVEMKGAVKCKNFGMTRMVQKRMLCAPSAISGNGLFLLEPAEKDEFITEYVGERISDDEAERRGAIYDRYQCSYIFNLETGGAIDAYKVGNLARFANNDNKNPTCYARTVVVAGEHRIGFYAKKKLEVGDELTFDYSYSGEHQVAFSFSLVNGKSTSVSKGPKRCETKASTSTSGSSKRQI